MKTRSWAHRLIEVLERSHHLVSHLWHRNVQNLDHGHDVGELLHGVVLETFLWPPAAHPGRVTGKTGLFLVQLEELQLGRRLFRNLAVACNSYLLPAPGLLLSPWGCVVVPLGQEHRDG